MRIQRGVLARGHGNLGQLLTGCAEFVYMPLRGQGIGANGCRAVAALKLFRRIAAPAASRANGKTV